MRRRTWMSLAVVAAVVAALLVTVYLRKKAPPEVARLLPEADAIVYFNLQPLRAITRFDQHPVAHDADYQSFIDATGIELERDLDQAAFAVHRMADPNGPNGPVAFSEVFSGHFNGQRLNTYLAAQAQSTERYAGHEIYSLAHDGRTVRVVMLGYDLVAVSNTPTAEQIHSIVDRYHSAASPFTGDTLLARHYSDVPLLSEVWGIGEIGLPFASGQHFQVFGLPLPVPIDSTFIASIRYLGALHVQLEEIAPSPQVAKMSVGVANVALGFLRSAQVNAGPVGQQDATVRDWEAMLRSASVEQKGNCAILRAVVPVSLVRSLVAATKNGSEGPSPNGQPVEPAP